MVILTKAHIWPVAAHMGLNNNGMKSLQKILQSFLDILGTYGYSTSVHLCCCYALHRELALGLFVKKKKKPVHLQTVCDYFFMHSRAIAMNNQWFTWLEKCIILIHFFFPTHITKSRCLQRSFTMKNLSEVKRCLSSHVKCAPRKSLLC